MKSSFILCGESLLGAVFYTKIVSLPIVFYSFHSDVFEFVTKRFKTYRHRRITHDDVDVLQCRRWAVRGGGVFLKMFTLDTTGEQHVEAYGYHCRSEKNTLKSRRIGAVRRHERTTRTRTLCIRPYSADRKARARITTPRRRRQRYADVSTTRAVCAHRQW